ncbi:MAG: protein translocase subunit SecD [Herpetosiphon sp.]|nr:protein translocase subunit SecD [Herpetosiphon sp.]
MLAVWIDFFPKSFQKITKRNVDTRYGLDLRGGAQIFLRPADANVENLKEKLQIAAGVIERRVNGLGVSEAVVQVVNDDSIVVELPDVKNPEEARQALQGAGNLEFIDPRGQFLADGMEVCTTITPRYPISQPVTSGETGIQGTNRISATNGISATNQLSPTNDLGTTNPVTQTEKPCTDPFTTIAKGTDLDTGVIALSTDQAGRPAVFFKFNAGSESASQIATFTAQNIGKPMSIVVDNRVISSPQINGSLPGEGIITMGGNQSRATQESQAKVLLNQLKYGALPVTLVEDSNRTISATLGEDSIRASLIAGIIGLIVVMVFMVAYYRLPGLLADIALIIYTLIAFAVYKLIPVTLTLPGIAGFILSIGLAVDANVLIFARIKEELHRGRSLDRAIEDGFTHAWPSIRDSNASTLITSFILYVLGNSFGVSIIQGFALTLALGIIVSLFTAITVSRMLLRMTVDFGVSNPRWFGVNPEHDAELAAQVDNAGQRV